jgi:hypothetical protein
MRVHCTTGAAKWKCGCVDSLRRSSHGHETNYDGRLSQAGSPRHTSQVQTSICCETQRKPFVDQYRIHDPLPSLLHPHLCHRLANTSRFYRIDLTCLSQWGAIHITICTAGLQTGRIRVPLYHDAEILQEFDGRLVVKGSSMVVGGTETRSYRLGNVLGTRPFRLFLEETGPISERNH